MKLILLKNSSGKSSASFTMVFITFNAVMLWFLLSLFSKIGEYEVPAFSGSDSMFLLSPLLALYFGGKTTTNATNKEKEEIG